ncbi:MAG: hypothetical protein IJ168_05855 [Eubacterium sp.]|nr:hypothetical protein [Eubacterium sp.]
MKKFISLLFSTIILLSTVAGFNITTYAAYDTIDTARNMTLGTTYSSSITSSNNIDYYKFTITSSSAVNWKFIGAINQVHIYFYNADGSDLWYNYYDANSSGQISLDRSIDLTKGTYYIAVSKRNGYTGNYSLTVSAVSAGESFNETGKGTNNTIQTANNISLGTTYKGQIAYNDNVDYYKFTITSSSAVNWKFIGAINQVHIYFYNADGSDLWYNYYDANSSGQVEQNNSIDLTKGTYYIAVSKRNSYTGNYSLTVSAATAGESFTETGNGTNNTIQTSNSISLGTTYKGQIAYNDYVDYYSFDVSDSTGIHLNLEGEVKGINIDIYNKDSASVFSDYYYANSAGKIVVNENITMPNGKYYLKISQRNNATGNYQFKLGSVKIGWQNINGKWFYYPPEANGDTIAIDFWAIDGKYYYFGDDGVMRTGWQTVNGNTYYFSKDGSALRWSQKIGNKYYYFNSSYVLQKGWLKISGKWYLFRYADGSMITGWYKGGKTWYYFNSSGVMQTGWQKIGGAWYWFNTSGAMKTGWQKIGGTWYYFKASGAMQTGWTKIGGKWYYFNTSGSMRTANLTQGGKTYRFYSSGACINP